MTDNDALENHLRSVLAHVDPVPPALSDFARASLTWRTVDEELAELMRDSADEGAEVSVRSSGTGGPRQLSFESPRVGIELEVVETGPRLRRLEGQLLPPGSAMVTLERPGEDGLSVQADDLGRFVVEGLRAGVVRLHVLLRGMQIAVPWTSI
jgi:hypothetical protein